MSRQREEERESLARRRADAQEELDLMAAGVEQIREKEESRSGLIIVKALYGKLQVIEHE